METQNMVEYCPDGTYLKISKGGKKLPLMRGQRTSLYDVAGAKHVEINCDDSQVRLRVQVPESSGPLTCILGLADEGLKIKSSSGVSQARNLEEWILGVRVASNGRW